MLDKSYRGLMNNKQGSFFEIFLKIELLAVVLAMIYSIGLSSKRHLNHLKYLSQLVKVNFKEVSQRKLNQILKVH